PTPPRAAQTIRAPPARRATARRATPPLAWTAMLSQVGRRLASIPSPIAPSRVPNASDGEAVYGLDSPLAIGGLLRLCPCRSPTEPRSGKVRRPAPQTRPLRLPAHGP